MKKILLSLPLLLLLFAAHGQKKLTVFSEDGTPFILMLNGKKINETPQSRVVATDLDEDFYKASVKQTNESSEIASANLSFMNDDQPVKSMTFVYKRSKKGTFVLRFFSYEEGDAKEPVSQATSASVGPDVKPATELKPVETKPNEGTGCLSDAEVVEVSQAAGKGLTDNSKFGIMRDRLIGKCLTTKQAQSLMRILFGEGVKFDFVKFVKPLLSDPKSFSQFEFEFREYYYKQEVLKLASGQ